MDRLAATRVFLTVVDQGGLSRAAEALEMSTAMVNRYIATLEKWLRVSLLERTTRKITLTEAGRLALPLCRAMLDKSERLQQHASALHHTPGGRLRIAVSSTFSECFLMDALVEFRRRYPEIAISLIVSDLPPELARERIDVSIRIYPLLEPHLIAKQLMATSLVFCAAPEYLRAHGMPSTPAELEQHRFIVHSLFDLARLPVHVDGRELSLQIKPVFTTSEVTVMRSAAVNGMGVVCLPHACVAARLDSGDLVRIMPRLETARLDYHATYLSGRHPPLSLRLMIRFLEEFFAGRGGLPDH